jgi:molybdopterin converting factor small subunit
MEITYYAGAADAAGTNRELLDTPDTTAHQLVSLLSARHEGLAGVLKSCSLLVDGSSVTDPQTRIPAGSRIDVLPPFAGG